MVPQFLARARRRCFLNRLLDQCVVALAIAMGGAILLLLAGTQILDWYWILLVAAASLGVGVYRLSRTVPSTYRLAQQIDRRLSLADALSTATYFASPEARGDLAIRERQRQEADAVARNLSPNLAVPFTRPRYVYYAAALTAAACALFVLRYAVTGGLNLRPSLVKIAFDTFFPPQTQLAKAKQPRDARKPPLEAGDQDAQTAQDEQTPETPVDANDAQDQESKQSADNSKEGAKKADERQSPDQQGENADKGEKQQNGNDADQQNPQNSKDGQQAGKQDSKQGSQSENSSLMDKLKDAMSNMLNKMKSPQKDSQTAQNQKSQQEKSSQTSKQGEQQKQNSSADSQSDQQQTNSGDPQQSADSKSGEKSSDKNASDDSKSGIGSADGDKSAKEAEQLQAMGKISEILGKRSQNVTGEVMVEVGQSHQQLKTPWAQKEAQHVEAGSEVHRDEVPLMYQQFVQQYFDEIRKGADSSKSPAKN